MADANDYLQFIKYILLQITIVPSLICDIFVFIHFIRYWKKEITTAPQNHIIFCLLIVSFIQKISDVPFAIYYFRWNIVYQQTYNFCVIWDWFNYTAMTVSLQLVCWCSLERHLFVFHSQMMKTKQFLILFHYIPMIICLSYTPIFYFRYIFFPTACTNTWDYTTIYCGGACYSYYDAVLGTFDWLFNYGLPTLIIIFANPLLFCRVLWQKINRQGPVQWSRQRRMIIQLSFIALLYLLFMAPQVIVGSMQTLWGVDFLYDVQADYLYYIVYFINQLLPFVIISSLPGTQKKLIKLMKYIKLFLSCKTQVHPLVTTIDGSNRVTLIAVH
ncbi:unnamed protein product [Adineta steineri]|uniref:G-protein coupled receptors family 1 profile domain-containing protein n=1 Tax=Adineta steineri TaxID=433720 RepID=A0A816EE96_9BILA|nr:unnamed protein product [Adineta steineri]CAF1505173.1 unnamed protein product [Adineta steineri]CAF1601098.1 unnamed protein product [Adineta steineri]CAF1645592.1 unnamed protein product [Adineta steineri]